MLKSDLQKFQKEDLLYREIKSRIQTDSSAKKKPATEEKLEVTLEALHRRIASQRAVEKPTQSGKNSKAVRELEAGKKRSLNNFSIASVGEFFYSRKLTGTPKSFQTNLFADKPVKLQNSSGQRLETAPSRVLETERTSRRLFEGKASSGVKNNVSVTSAGTNDDSEKIGSKRYHYSEILSDLDASLSVRKPRK